MVEQSCPNCGKPYQVGDEVCRFCGFVFPFSTAVITPGTTLQGRYEIQELIHSGGMGYVYLAKDKRLYDRSCIVKQVKEPVKSEIQQKKLEEEALRMAKLNHPNIAMIFDHFTESGYYFLVVERISGKTLSEVFKEQQGQLREEEVVKWAISICDVVSYLHGEEVVHRDISPDNIMLTNEGVIKFIDFGTSREFRYIVSGGTAGTGKYGYTPFEQWRGKPEPRSDIFALGATIYYLLTGFLPLSKEYLTDGVPQKEDINPHFPPIRTKNPKVSPQLEAILQKALQLDVNSRFSSAAEFGQALRGLTKKETKEKAQRKAEAVAREKTRRETEQKPAPVEKAARAGRRITKSVWLWAGVGALLLASLGTALFLTLTPLETVMTPTTPTMPTTPPPVAPITSPGESSEPGPVLDTLKLILHWENVPDADYYILTISQEPYDNIIYSTEVTSTSWYVPSGTLVAGEKYCWYVQAHGSGGLSDVSNTLYFQAPPYALSGYVLEFGSNAPIGSAVLMEVYKYDDTTSSWVKHGYTITSTEGYYVVPLSSSGEYAVKATATGYVPEWYDRAYSQDKATPVSITASGETSNINFSLGTTIELPFYEDFEGALPNWNLETGWQTTSIDGNTILRGSGHYFAKLMYGSWDNYILKVRFKIIQGGIHFNFRSTSVAGGFNRYFIGVGSDNVMLNKQRGDEFFHNLAGTTLYLGSGWHEIEIRGFENMIYIYLDGQLRIDYVDENPITAGGISFETLDNSEFLIDDVEVRKAASES